MQLVLWILSVAVLAGKAENWWISWVGTFFALVIVVLTRIMNPTKWFQKSKESME